MNGNLFNTKLLTFNSQRQSSETFRYPSIPVPVYARRVDTVGSLEQSFLTAHVNNPRVVGGYIFDEVNFPRNFGEISDPIFQVDLTANRFKWSVVFNYSLTLGEDVPFMINRITNAIAKGLPQPTRIVLEGVKPMPVRERAAGFGRDIIALGGTLAYFFLLNQLLPVFLTTIVAEKESKIREAMKMTGLKLWIYW